MSVNGVSLPAETSTNYHEDMQAAFANITSTAQQESRPSVDRKTLYKDGMLALTHIDLVLYSGDEKDEIKRIPIRSIASCSCGRIRKSLIVKHRVNVQENFDKHLNKLRNKLEKINIQKDSTESIKSGKSSDLQTKSIKLQEEIHDLTTDSAIIQRVKNKKADIVKETFQLPNNYAGKHAPDEEYRIWEYAVKRRMEGIKKIRIESSPSNAIILVDDQVYESTPATIDKPLIDSAAISGNYNVQIALERFKPHTLKISSDVSKPSQLYRVRLKEKKERDDLLDEIIRKHRAALPDRTIDIEQYGVESKISGYDCTMVQAKEEIIILSPDENKCIVEIPYGAINKIRLVKKFMRGIQALHISYVQDEMDLEYEFIIDRKKYGSAETQHRYEGLEQMLNKRRKEHRNTTLQPRIRSAHNYSTISESDILNNYKRFDPHPHDFEYVVAELFGRMGYQSERIGESGDKGVDVLARTPSETIVIQVKKWNSNVGGPDVNKTLGSMVYHKATRAIVISTADFTNQAYEIQQESPVELWNAQRLASEFKQYGMVRSQ